MGSDTPISVIPLARIISIHAPRVGSDLETMHFSAPRIGFQSTLPVWGATPCVTQSCSPSHISIHAPRVGSDGLLRMRLFQTKKNFNPRSPCGERLFNRFCHLYGRRYFNPRSPCGERQLMDAETWITPEISIHAPRVGSDKSL